MSAYDITDFLRTAYQPFAYCVPSKTPRNTAYQKGGCHPHAYKNITEKMNLLKMCGLQIWLCLFMFRPIASKQLTRWCTGKAYASGARGPGFNSGSYRGFMFEFLFCCVFTFCPKTRYLSQNFAIPFAMLITKG